MQEKQKQMKFEKGVYAGILSGDIATEWEEISSPRLQWIGKKMSYFNWRQILSFLVANKINEACIYLLYSPGEGIFPFVPDQEVDPTSVHINNEKLAAVLVNDVVLLGDLHSHPSFSAFASSIDRTSEARSHGVYITLGNLSQSVADYHIRTQINGYVYEDQPDIFSLIELPEVIIKKKESLEESSIVIFQKKLQEFLLFSTKKTNDYPLDWDRNLLVKQESFFFDDEPFSLNNNNNNNPFHYGDLDNYILKQNGLKAQKKKND